MISSTASSLELISAGDCSGWTILARSSRAPMLVFVLFCKGGVQEDEQRADAVEGEQGQGLPGEQTNLRPAQAGATTDHCLK